MGSTKRTLTVVIPTKNRRDDLARCLRSLQSQTWKYFDILVIDNGSTDGTLELARNYGVRVVVDATSNLSRLFNLGWKLADTDIIAYLNDDTEVVPEWAYIIYSFLNKEKDVKVLGGPTIATRSQRMFSVYLGSQSSRLLGFIFKIYNATIMRGKFFEIGLFDEWGNSTIGGSLPQSVRIPNPRSVDGLSITNLAIRREVLQELGGFDESFRYVHSDGDFFLRIRKRGYKMVFHPKMIAYHYLNPIGNTRSPYFWGRDFAILWLKHAKSRKARFMSLLHCLFITGYVWLFTSKVQRIVQLKLWLRGLLDGLFYYLHNRQTILM